MPTAQAIKCGCGKTLSIPPTFKAAKAKCPGCGAILPVAGATAASKILQTIAGYGVTAVVEKGARGEILRARDPQGKAVRLVGPPPAVADVPEYVARFKQEALAAKSLAHPNLLKVLNVVDAAGKPYAVTEDVEGETLAAIFARGEPMDVQRAAGIFAQILAAMTAAHNAKVIHRDLRPESVWIGPDGKARVAGFGLAKPGARDLKGVPQDAVDLPHYTAPELIKGEAVTQRVDLYSVGCMFYQALTGRTPYSETQHARLRMMLMATQDPVAVRQVRNEVSVPLSRLIMRLMAKDSQQRYMKADVALRDLAAQTGIEAPEAAPPPSTTAGDDGAYEEEEACEEEEQEARSGLSILAWLGIGGFVVAVLVAAYFVVQSLSVPNVPAEPGAGGPTPTVPNGNGDAVVNVDNPPPNGGNPVQTEDLLEVKKRILKRDLERFFVEADQFGESLAYEMAVRHYNMIASRIGDDGLSKEFGKEQTRARALQELCKVLQEAMKALDEGRFEDAKKHLDVAKATLLKVGDADVAGTWTGRIQRHVDQLKDAPLAAAQRKLFEIWSADLRGVTADEIDGYFATLTAAPDSKYTKETFTSGKEIYETRVKQIRSFVEVLDLPNAEKLYAKLRTSFGRAPWAEPDLTTLREEIEKAKAEMPPEENP